MLASWVLSSYFEHAIISSFLLPLHAFLVKKIKQNKKDYLEHHNFQVRDTSKSRVALERVFMVFNGWTILQMHQGNGVILQSFKDWKTIKQGEVIPSVTCSLTHVPYIPVSSQFHGAFLLNSWVHSMRRYVLHSSSLHHISGTKHFSL